MIVINIFIAIIIAIGFWRNTSKEHKRKVAKASLTKTVILFLLSAAITFFYYKSYQVATITNYIQVSRSNTSYYYANDTTYKNNRRDTIVVRRCPPDSLQSIFLYNNLGNDTSYHEISRTKTDSGYYTKVYDKFSGILFRLKMENHNDKEITVRYTASLVPYLFPISNISGFYKMKALEDTTKFDITYSSTIHGKIIRGGQMRQDCGFWIKAKEIDAKEKFIYPSVSAFSKFINTFNFFSAADLSQCEYLLDVDSEIPIGTINVSFNLPIKVWGLDNFISSYGMKHFTINYAEQSNISGWDPNISPIYFHITFPTLANLQLIRSLILTTLLTALLALFFKNLYYYCRKIYERRKRKRKKPLTDSRKMVLLWIPVGEIILWTFIVSFTFWLILSILNYHFIIPEENVPIMISQIGISILLYMILLCGTFYFLYKKGIYIRDIIDKIKCRTKLYMGRIKERIINLFSKTKNKKNGEKDGKLPPDKEDKPEETSKKEDSVSNEVTNQEDGQKPSSKPSRPQKRKSHKRRR